MWEEQIFHRRNIDLFLHLWHVVLLHCSSTPSSFSMAFGGCEGNDLNLIFELLIFVDVVLSLACMNF